MDGTSPVTRIYHEIWSNSDSDNNKPYTYAVSCVVHQTAHPEPASTICNAVWTKVVIMDRLHADFCVVTVTTGTMLQSATYPSCLNSEKLVSSSKHVYTKNQVNLFVCSIQNCRMWFFIQSTLEFQSWIFAHGRKLSYNLFNVHLLH